MTKRQTEALAFIKSFIKEHGHSPTYREIADHLGNHTGNAHRLVEALESMGKVKTYPYKHRSLEVL